MTRVRLAVDGRTYDVAVHHDADGRRTVEVDGQRFTVTVRPAGGRAVDVTVDGRAHRVVRADLANVVVDDVTCAYRIDGVTADDAGGVLGAGGASVRPPMPGKVVSVRVRPGDTVAAGEVLLVLEAMKMQNEVTSPAAATVREVRVQAGTTVDTSDVLLVLAAPEAEAPDARPKVMA